MSRSLAQLLFAVGLMALGIHAGRGGAIDHWTQRSSEALNRVRYCGGVFVGVGAGGKIVTSSNGIVWTRQNSGTTRDLRGVAFGAFQSVQYFVVVGDNTMIFSQNLTTWVPVPLTNSCDLRDIAYGAFNFVAVGAPPYNVMRSVGQIFPPAPPGPPTNWAARTLTATPTFFCSSYTNAWFTSIVWAPGFVAVGEICTGIWWSGNGSTWSFRDWRGRAHFEGVASGNSRLVVVGVEGPPLVSTNGGSTWTNSLVNSSDPQDPDNFSSGFDIAYGAGLFAAVGGHTGLLTTSNGMDWIQHPGVLTNRLNPHLSGYGAVNSVTYGAGTFVASSWYGGIFQSDSIGGRLAFRRDNATGPVELSVSIDPGRTFGVEASSNFAHWAEVWRGTNNGTSTSTQFLDWTVTNGARTFYRTRTP